jgi:hypothetical protein
MTYRQHDNLERTHVLKLCVQINYVINLWGAISARESPRGLLIYSNLFRHSSLPRFPPWFFFFYTFSLNLSPRPQISPAVVRVKMYCNISARGGVSG